MLVHGETARRAAVLHIADGDSHAVVPQRCNGALVRCKHGVLERVFDGNVVGGQLQLQSLDKRQQVGARRVLEPANER